MWPESMSADTALRRFSPSSPPPFHQFNLLPRIVEARH
jgi:hypothetical protein